jgi:hypothetical protein
MTDHFDVSVSCTECGARLRWCANEPPLARRCVTCTLVVCGFHPELISEHGDCPDPDWVDFEGVCAR